MIFVIWLHVNFILPVSLCKTNQKTHKTQKTSLFLISHIQCICKSCWLCLQNTSRMNLFLLLRCYLRSLSHIIPHSPHFLHYLHCRDSQSFWSQDPFTLLKIIEDPKELFLIWVLSVDVYCIRNWNREIVQILINCLKRTIYLLNVNISNIFLNVLFWNNYRLKEVK